eukprot:2837090-Alexandrium_andersonii.AAC.1
MDTLIVTIALLCNNIANDNISNTGNSIGNTNDRVYNASNGLRVREGGATFRIGIAGMHCLGNDTSEPCY